VLCVRSRRRGAVDQLSPWIGEGELTVAPVAVLTANVNSLVGLAAPSTLRVANAAACPSIGCETPLSTEYSCRAPLILNPDGSGFDEIPTNTSHCPSGETL